ncbi:alpha-E domain-containing protein [Mariprofundus erugo]|uniref:alpha-E domain-containing protein n=1 Tax=Mariprofundus erugo TaxID=2528639 RepID=UPI0010FDD2D0|nr:alpha-E domain-containing protein [Mariprofundus erugo]TLS78313.1 alpha-E domain-containing protein [Mariprofundus erugo]
MLSRIARNIYELGQQIERAENIARILDVNRRMSLEQSYFSELDVWSPMLAITRSRAQFDAAFDTVTEQHVMDFLISDISNPYSIRACLSHAREMARTIRERISEEMWLCLNKMYQDIQQHGKTENHDEFLIEIRQFCSAFHGLVDNTMSHGESWNFLRLGVALERARMTTRILEIKYYLLLPDNEEVGRPLDHHQWQALLRSVSGYEAYRRQFKARIDPFRVLRLLNLDPSFPRSVHYSIRQVADALKGIGTMNEEQYVLLQETEYFLDDLRGGAAEDEMMRLQLKTYLDTVQQRCEVIGAMINRTFFNSVTVTLTEFNRDHLSIQIPQQQQ